MANSFDNFITGLHLYTLTASIIFAVVIINYPYTITIILEFIL